MKVLLKGKRLKLISKQSVQNWSRIKEEVIAFEAMSSTKNEGHEEPPKEQSKAMDIFWGVFKTVSLLTLLYFFICSITFLEDAFKLVSGQNAGK